jgi:fatty-acyl-CoA synthase
MAHPDVISAGVVGVPDSKWGESVMAFVVLRSGATVGESDLQAHVKRLRGAPWAPKSIEFRSELPLTGVGKLDRKALRRPYWRNEKRSVS